MDLNNFLKFRPSAHRIHNRGDSLANGDHENGHGQLE